jgi:hypothetical protein
LRRTAATRAPLSKPPAASDRLVRKLSALVPRRLLGTKAFEATTFRNEIRFDD